MIQTDILYSCAKSATWNQYFFRLFIFSQVSHFSFQKQLTEWQAAIQLFMHLFLNVAYVHENKQVFQLHHLFVDYKKVFGAK